MTGTLLSGSYKALSTNTPSVCAALCLSQGYIYAGVEYSSRASLFRLFVATLW